MRAALLTGLPTTSLELVERDKPELQPGEALVEVAACGICGTDLHIMAGESYRPSLPFVLGHELVGTVVAVGDRADSQWVGCRVVPTLFLGCGSCRPCLAGDERLCEEGALATGVLGRDGGFATHVLLATGQLVEVPALLSDEIAASLVDAGTTAANAVRVALGASAPGERPYLVLGGGPVGLLVAELLRHGGADPVVVEANQLRRSVLADRGYRTVASLHELEGLFSAVIDCAGDGSVIPGALALIRPQGTYVSVGYAIVPELDLALIARRELRLVGVRSGTRADLENILELVASGAVVPAPLETWKLDDINHALESLRRGIVHGRAVILMSGAGQKPSDSRDERQETTHG